MAIKITQHHFQNAVYKAVQRTYLKALVIATPGSGIVSDSWDIEFQGNNVVLVNREFGNIIRFLNDGTKNHIITAKGVTVSGNTIRSTPGKQHYLRFPSGGERKSAYRKIEGNVAFKKNGYVFAKAVRNPGIKAKKFINSVMEDPQLKKDFDAELDKEFSKFLT